MSRIDQFPEAKAYLTPPEVAKLLGVDRTKILHWIHRGELRAVNLAADCRRRPRFKIALSSLEEFLNARATGAAPQPIRHRRSVGQNVGEYY